MITIICPHCGKDIPEDALSCDNCGAMLAPPAPVESAPTPSTIPTPRQRRRTPAWWKVLRCLFSLPLTALLAAALTGTVTLFAAYCISPADPVAAQLLARYPTAADLLGQLTPTVLGAAVGACLLLFALIALCNLRGYYLTSLYSGIALLLGGLFASAALAANSFAVTWITSMPRSLAESVVECAVRPVLAHLWIPGVCMVAVGTLCCVLFGVKRFLRHYYKQV